MPSTLNKTQRQSRKIADHVAPAGSVWIDDHRAALPNNEWVAADGTGLLASSPAIEDLMNELGRKNIAADQIVIAFTTKDAV